MHSDRRWVALTEADFKRVSKRIHARLRTTSTWRTMAEASGRIELQNTTIEQRFVENEDALLLLGIE